MTAPDLIPIPAVAAPGPRTIAFPRTAAIGASLASLLYEDFSGYREGDAPGWGPATFVKTGLDHCHWLVSNVDGSHPVGCRIRLPEVFSFECRYSACLPEVNRGILGWWKEPVSTTIAFPDDRGGRCVVEWVIKYGNDPTEFNPVGSSSLFAKKYHHTITLPDGSSNEVGVVQPTGLLRIDVKNSAVTVFIDGQAVVAGSITAPASLSGSRPIWSRAATACCALPISRSTASSRHQRRPIHGIAGQHRLKPLVTGHGGNVHDVDLGI